ncbi:hypothetical protein ABIB08_001109 [Bradyrhizobium sp. RT11b]
MSVRGHLAACGIEKAGRSLRRPAFAYEAALTNPPGYFVTWPRISPPGLAAVWMLT